MQIQLQLKPKTTLEIPLNYNYQLQSAIYSKLREIGVSDFWHDLGFGDKEAFKLFVFGPLKGNYKIEDKKIIFDDTVSLEIRSSIFDFCDDFQRSIEKNTTFKFFDEALSVCGASITNRHINSKRVIFKTASPIVLHTISGDGKTVYLKPESDEFLERLHENFYKKYYACYETEPPEIKIYLLDIGKKVVTKYKEIWVTAYNCTLEVEGPYDALEFLYNSGFGERNSQGFGMVDII